ncbi:hypothetical protein BYT27DRAFT_7219635 [Phlegmacium glaucopus]|nr:hypothetical protein BYT27DRAFT_7219635 [Phlegmacium glaucopus]
MSHPVNLLNIYDLQDSPYRLDSLCIQEILYYCEARFSAALRAIARAGPPKEFLLMECFLDELWQIFCLSFVGLAMVMGQSVQIPVVIRSLAQNYEFTTSAAKKFELDANILEYLESGIVDVPGGHIRTFFIDWWDQGKTPTQRSGIFSMQTVSKCLEFHNQEIERVDHHPAEHSMAEHAAAPQPATRPVDSRPAPGQKPSTPLSPDGSHRLNKLHYCWHHKIWDDEKGGHCPQCRLYRAASLGLMDDLHGLQNLVDSMETTHQAERALSVRRASGFNLFFEVAVVKDVNGPEPGAASSVAPCPTHVDPSRKWTWGVDLNEKDLIDMVWAADRGFVLPHLGYDESLIDCDLPSDSAGPNKKVHQQLDKELLNPPQYEPLSADI